MQQEVRCKLDHIINIRWKSGVSDSITYIEQLSYLIYLKLLDEKESIRESEPHLIASDEIPVLFPKQAQRYRWSKWNVKPSSDLLDFIRNDVFSYMASLVKEEPSVAEYFRDAILEIQDPNALKLIVDEINHIHFHQLDSDTKSEMFEYLFKHLGELASNDHFRTPRQLRLMMIEMVDPNWADTILDPATGTGSFLIDAFDYVLAKYTTQPKEIPIYGNEWLELRQQTIEQAKTDLPTLQTYHTGIGDKLPDKEIFESSIYGFDISRKLVRISTMNLILRSMLNIEVKWANILLESSGLNTNDLQRKYSVILSTPPFTSKMRTGSIRRDLLTNSKKSEVLFLTLMMQSLVPGGRCAVIVPEGLLISLARSDMVLRKRLVEEYHLQAVVSLPTGIFKPYAAIKTSILLFCRPVLEQEESTVKHDTKIWFYDVEVVGYDLSKISRGIRLETPEHNDIPDLLQQWQVYKRSDFENPPGIEAGTHIEVDHAENNEPRCWWTTIKTVAENNYKLTASHYKPFIIRKQPDEDPIELIREALAMEKEVYEELEALLREMEALV